MKLSREILRAVSAVTLLVVFASISVLAQVPTGTILGVVKDATGGSIPNASVTVQSVESSFTRTGKTGDDGAFRFPALAVGHYTVKVEMTGFKTETQTGLALDVDQEEVVNFALEVGTTSQEVVVTAEAPQVNTTSGSVGHMVEEQQIAELPLNGRNYADLSLLQTGVTQYQHTGGQGEAGLWFSSNGAPVRSNMFTLDGAVLGSVAGVSPSSITGQTLGVDAIREYKVMTNNFSAEYGLRMGSQVVIVTKSGSNQFHGDGFEYLRNSALDARQYFDNLYQLPTTVPGGGRRVAPFRRNQFGGALGGPIKKDKTFFFTTYEGFRQTLDNPNYLGIATVPPAACHFASTAAGVVTTTPLSPTAPNNMVSNAACLKPLGTTAGPATGTTTVDPSIAQNIIPLYPLPNFTLGGFPSFDYLSTETTRDDYGQVRIDQILSSTDTLFGRYTIDDSQQTRPAILPVATSLYTSRSQYITLSETHIFSPTLLNSGSFSFSRANVFQVNQTPGYTGPPCLAGRAALCGLGANPVSAIGNDTSNPIIQTQNVFSWSDGLIWTKGKHALKFGTLIDYWQQWVDNNAKAGGLFNFTNFQGLLLGNYSSISLPVQGSFFGHNMLFDTIGFYVQDDYRVLPRLTLNLGLRYEFLTTPTEKRGRSAYITNVVTQTTFIPGPLQNAPSPTQLSPRFGFAWDIFGNGKTSLRGGAALLYDVGGMGSVYGSAGASPPFATYSATATKPLVLPEPLPPAPANLYSPIGSKFTALQYNFSMPRMVDFNLSVDRQLPGDIAISVAYAGSRGTHLWQWEEGNPNCPTQNPFVPVGCSSVTTAVGPTEWLEPTGTGAGKSPLQNPSFNSVNFIQATGDSWYNSLQVNLTKRVGHGLQFQSSYTYSKALDDNQGQISSDTSSASTIYNLNPYDKEQDWGRAGFDVRQNWHFNALYHVPNIGSSTLAKFEHGWWVGTVVAVQTGAPFTIYLNTNRDQSNVDGATGGLDRADIVTSANIAAITAQAQSQCASTPTSSACSYTPVIYNKNTVITSNPNSWYNANMFALPTVGVPGNEGRNMLTGPGLATWDLSFNKNTALPFLGEAGQLQFRTEIFNLLNHANFGQPSAVPFLGTIADKQEAPSVTPISTTTTDPREIQFSLKVLF